jgi:ABC-type multidrug transport system ATPase subunit
VNDPAVEVVSLVKRYPKRPTNAVDEVDFQVPPGEVFGLLGPNGAGKTTTIGILTTRVVPTAGIARVREIDVARNPVLARSMLSVVPQRPNLDFALNARQILLFHAAYHGVPTAERNRRADALLEQFGLSDRGDDKVLQFSGGMTQRLLIARALMHAPDVIFLDEPSTGLDPQARLFVWDKIRELQAAGITVVLTTHDMDEAATLADRVGIMDKGQAPGTRHTTCADAIAPGQQHTRSHHPLRRGRHHRRRGDGAGGHPGRGAGRPGGDRVRRTTGWVTSGLSARPGRTSVWGGTRRANTASRRRRLPGLTCPALLHRGRGPADRAGHTRRHRTRGRSCGSDHR